MGLLRLFVYIPLPDYHADAMLIGDGDYKYFNLFSSISKSYAVHDRFKGAELHPRR